MDTSIEMTTVDNRVAPLSLDNQPTTQDPTTSLTISLSAPPNISLSAPPNISLSAPPNISLSAPPNISLSAPPNISLSAPPNINLSAQININLSAQLNSNFTIDFMSLEKPFDIIYVRCIFIILYVMVFLCCVIGNATVIYVILRHRKMRNITNFFLANLAASDLCVGLFCILPNLSSFLSPYWLLGRLVCKVYYFIQCTSYTASVLILTVISLERFFAIIHPMLNKRFTRMCLLRVVVIIIWACAALYGVPNLIVYDIYRVEAGNQTMDFCVITGNWHLDMDVYSIVNFIVLYALPLVLITVMYARISGALWRSGRNMGVTGTTRYTSKTFSGSRNVAPRASCSKCSTEGTTTNSECQILETASDSTENSEATTKHLNREISMDVDKRKPNWLFCHVMHPSQWARSVDEPERTATRMCSCQVSETGQLSSKSFMQTLHKRKTVCNPLATRRKVIRLLICIIVAFAVCVLPHHIRLLHQYWSPGVSLSFTHMLIPPITFLFFYANSALNPFLYALLSDHFRRAFMDVLPPCGPCRRSGGRRDVMPRGSRAVLQKTSTFDSSSRMTPTPSTGLSNGTCSTSTVF